MAYSEGKPPALSSEPKSLESNIRTLDHTQNNQVLELAPLPTDEYAKETEVAIATAVTATRSHKEPVNVLSLLVYLREIKEFELYYYLFNQVNIASIADNKAEISREGADKSLNNRLAEILFTWTGLKWGVIITDTSNSQSLKEGMKAKFMESEEWKMLQSYSGSVTLTDIILD